MWLTGGGQFGQNGQKLKNDKISIFGSKQWGDKPIVWVVRGGSPPVPPFRGNPDGYVCEKKVRYVTLCKMFAN